MITYQIIYHAFLNYYEVVEKYKILGLFSTINHCYTGTEAECLKYIEKIKADKKLTKEINI